METLFLGYNSNGGIYQPATPLSTAFIGWAGSGKSMLISKTLNNVIDQGKDLIVFENDNQHLIDNFEEPYRKKLVLDYHSDIQLENPFARLIKVDMYDRQPALFNEMVFYVERFMSLQDIYFTEHAYHSDKQLYIIIDEIYLDEARQKKLAELIQKGSERNIIFLVTIQDIRDYSDEFLSQFANLAMLKPEMYQHELLHRGICDYVFSDKERFLGLWNLKRSDDKQYILTKSYINKSDIPKQSLLKRFIKWIRGGQHEKEK